MPAAEVQTITNKTFDAIYENGVFRPVEPLPLVNGLRVGLSLSPPNGPLSDANVEAMMRLGAKCFEELSEKESAALEAGMTGVR
jgi:predicted DNA-binding antitoxin AbrB/MazE fold protein